MAFEYPSTITARKEKEKKMKTNKKLEADKKEQAKINKFTKAVKPVFEMKEKPGSYKKEIAMMQLEDSLSRTEGAENLSNKSLKKVVDATIDDKQLERSERRMMRNMKSGGRVKLKGGGCAKRGVKKNAYGKNS